jgi:hypothetical protein
MPRVITTYHDMGPGEHRDIRADATVEVELAKICIETKTCIASLVARHRRETLKEKIIANSKGDFTANPIIQLRKSI